MQNVEDIYQQKESTRFIIYHLCGCFHQLIITCNFKLKCFLKFRISPLYLYRCRSTPTQPPCCAATVAHPGQTSSVLLLHFTVFQQRENGIRKGIIVCCCWITSLGIKTKKVNIIIQHREEREHLEVHYRHLMVTIRFKYALGKGHSG